MMFVEIVNGRVCPVCGAPVGRMVDESGELLGYTCYGKTPHVVEPTVTEVKEHSASGEMRDIDRLI
jgi:hypothetical protein